MILITGANGLVGSYITRQLIAEGNQVRAIYRPGCDMTLIDDVKDNVDWVEGDILDLFSLGDAMQGITHVYHAAAIISYLHKDYQAMHQVNVQGTANVVNLCIEMGIQKLLYVSSIAAIGKSSKTELVQESNIWEQNKHTTGYAISKHAAEMEVWRGIAEGLNAVIINPSVIVGAGNWHNGSCRLFSTVHKGFKFYTTGKTGYVDVRDVANIAILLMQSNISSERFIVNSENLTFQNFFYAVADALHKKRPPYKAGKVLSALAWRADALLYLFTGKVPSVTKQTARTANSSYIFDNTKITSTLNYTFVPIKKTIAETAHCFLNEKITGNYKPLSAFIEI